MKLATYLSKWLRAAAFVALFLFAVMFALKNTDPVTLRFYLEQTWQAPLIVALFAAFALGAALGVLACFARWFRQRREIAALRRELRSRSAPGGSPTATDS